jgi:hypothetical protein
MIGVGRFRVWVTGAYASSSALGKEEEAFNQSNHSVTGGEGLFVSMIN